MHVFLPTAYEYQSTRLQNLLSRRLPLSAERLRPLNIDNSVSDEKRLTIIAVKRSKAFQKSRGQHVEGP